MDEITTVYCKNCEINARAKILEKFTGKTWTSFVNLGKYGKVPTLVNHFERHGLVLCFLIKKDFLARFVQHQIEKLEQYFKLILKNDKNPN
ncbi:MAG: hypothetical protein MAG458_01375 [Nitrosopumilus sp.]|nr:hypothetical protein [Nitrosopumilus sp.]